MLKPTKKNLTEFEIYVTEQKGTEKPFTGEYEKTTAHGVYLCKRCETPLFLSEHKFDSHCGWPSFDNELEGKITRVPDADGRRTEITCTRCGAHLGHVFTGENHTVRNLRHCVNSISMTFKANDDLPKGRALLASGCFWGTEFHFAKAPGVLQTKVGFAGGHVKNPSYREVCGGQTGHLECIEVIYDTSKTTYETMLKLFFETHDFGQENGQGPDIGPQYLSAIFALDSEQKKVAEKVIGWLKENNQPVATRILGEAAFYPAEEKHQKYYFKEAKTPYCHIYRKVFPSA